VKYKLTTTEVRSVTFCRERMVKVRELFRDTESTEFIIVTIPTVMALSESTRLCASLEKENVPVKSILRIGYQTRDKSR